MDIRDAKIKVLTNLVKVYRARLERYEKPFDEKRVLQILRCPSAALVNSLLEEANLTEPELEAVNHCVRLDYTQEEAADVLECSRNYIQKNRAEGLRKLKTAWAALGFL